MDNDDVRHNVNHLNYSEVGLLGSTLPTSPSRPILHHGNNNNTVMLPAAGKLSSSATALYQRKANMSQYSAAEHKLLNGYNLQNGSTHDLEWQIGSEVCPNPTSAQLGKFNSLPSRINNNNGNHYIKAHTKSTSNSAGAPMDLPPEGVAHNLEQMRLLHKFKELRRQQIQQQEILMQQQEKQLALLRQEMTQRQRQVNTFQPQIDNWKEKQLSKVVMQTPPMKKPHRTGEISLIPGQQIPEDLQKTVYYQLEEDNDISSLDGDEDDDDDDDPGGSSHLSPYHTLDGIRPFTDGESESETESGYVETKETNVEPHQTALSPGSRGHMMQPSELKMKLFQSNKTASPDSLATEEQAARNPRENSNLRTPSNPLDEQPISSNLGRKKTFEQLIEEQLKKEKEQEGNTSQSAPTKRPFLRRGQGIARFNPPPDEKSVQRAKKGQRAMSSVPPPPPAAALPKETSRRPMSQPVMSSNKMKVSKSESVKSLKPPKYPTNHQKLKLGRGASKPVPCITPALMNSKPQPLKTAPLSTSSSSSSQSNQSAVSFSSLPSAIPTNSKEVENILRAIYDGKPISDKDDSNQQISQGNNNPKRISPTNSVEIEKYDLAEFELMEQMADDMSFCSDSSVVMKFMDKRLPAQGSESSDSKMVLPVQRNTFRKPFPETSGEVVKSSSLSPSWKSLESLSPNHDDTLVNLSDTETLTDFPDKGNESEGISDNQSVLEYEESDIEEADSTAKKSSAIQSQIDHLFEESDLGHKKGNDPRLPNKDLVKISRKMTVASQLDFEVMKGSDTVFSAPKVITRKIASKDDWSKQKLTRDANSVTSTSSVQTTSEVDQKGAGRATNSDFHSSDECFTDNGAGEDSSASDSSSSSSVVDEFDDYHEWNDTCDSIKKNLQHFDPNESDGNEEDPLETSEKSSVGPKKASPLVTSPPTSKLVSKLFPVLQGKTAMKDPKAQELQAVSQVPIGDGVQSKLLREKLNQLEKEIACFKQENANLERLRREREEGVKKLRKEMSDFESAKKEELDKLYEFKEEEMRKLRNERKVFEKYHKAVRSLPNKEQRQEIETLKIQLSEFQEEMRRKESRWNSNTNRLRQRIQDLEDENKQLREEVTFMENKRLEWLQEKDVLVQNQKKLSQKNHKLQSSNAFGLGNNSEVAQNENKVHQMFMASPAGDYRFVGGGKRKDNFDSGKNVRGSSEAVPRQPSAVLATPQELNDRNGYVHTDLKQKPSELRKKQHMFNHSPIIKGDIIEELQHPDGKTERRYQGGAREVIFSNGTRKEMSPDGRYIILWFFNGDVKQITEDQTVVYYYAESQTTVTTYPDGLEVLEFPKGQIEKHYPNGTQEITFPDQTVKYLRPDGSEESHCQDGTIIKVDATGVRTLEFPNGQREIHTEKFKRREYPDGTQKTIYPDGRQETKFSNGRIRIKDKEGNVLLDKKF